MLRNIGPMELIVILFLALLLFGPERLSDRFGDLGSALRSFKEGLQGDYTATNQQETDNSS